jgi:hypothetical protein
MNDPIHISSLGVRRGNFKPRAVNGQISKGLSKPTTTDDRTTEAVMATDYRLLEVRFANEGREVSSEWIRSRTLTTRSEEEREPPV